MEKEVQTWLEDIIWTIVIKDIKHLKKEINNLLQEQTDLADCDKSVNSKCSPNLIEKYTGDPQKKNKLNWLQFVTS